MCKYLQKDLEISGPNAQYDTYAKLLLSNKIILAYILIYVAPEFRGMRPDEVVPLIEGEPQVGEIPVSPGETNMPVITGTNTENKIPAEGTVTYDIHFYVWVPGRQQKIKIIVDVEAQKHSLSL